VLRGKDAPIDHGDGAGMNLMELCSKDWCDDLLNVCAPKLKEKLPELSSSDHNLGPIHSYFTAKYSIPSNCQVVIGSGDNPSSLVGCGATDQGTAVISLGTSDTFFSASGYKTTDTKGIGHIFGNPAGGWMGLICFRNGSLTREAVLKRFGLNWKEAEEMISRSAPTDIEQSPLPYFEDEISPSLTSTTKVEDLNEDAGIAISSLVESQVINMKLMSKKHLKIVKMIRLTGGGSKNNAIAQMIADVFQAEVQCISTDKSAALGAAMRAAQAVFKLPFKTLSERFIKTERIFAPRTEYRQHYVAKETELNNRISLAQQLKVH
jgi:xylulokinase